MPSPVPSVAEFVARGKVISVRDGSVVFVPNDTSYELHLVTKGRYDGPVNIPIDARIRATVRKLLTVSSGGAFVAPIFGPPRTIQGRVRCVGDGAIVVAAGLSFTLALPAADHALDLNSGPISVGTMVNAIVMPGATLEWISASVGVASMLNG